ncbi:YsnF/AvaK domain-containing protein [Lichenibacterium dinghuense]|uniref:YsnF/AvaK domain-containing protein n=1 Tax=Lichenibacterium dinghuense TaxID=2895977 RepID=UPI001F18A760|nr:YsnF/AvaK domain-containing protein [Lichenibacterium sp. 6Y81]
MSKQTITALYDDRSQADQAATMLRQAGVPAGDVTVSPSNARDAMEARGDARTRDEESTGFWSSLENFFGGTPDHDTYREGIRRGGTLLTAHVADEHVDKAVEILERHGSVDFDERETSWRSEGWTGAAAAGPGMAGGTATGLAMSAGGAKPAMAPAPRSAPPAKAARGGEDVIQVVEERLDVGKRAVSRGKVRLHSYVVEKDVSEDVRLRNETLTVDRHAVDRPVAALGADAFKERTVEMVATGEEAVVGKTARVVEEIGIRKDVKDRVETVKDTVRSTKVDVEDDRGTASEADRLGRKV